MENEFTLEMKESLTALKQEIFTKLKSNKEEYNQIADSADAKDEVDIASVEIDRTMLDALGAQDVKRLKLIESALLRIEQGKYGICLKCGKKIPKERLLAIPYAFMCVDCKNVDERRNR